MFPQPEFSIPSWLELPPPSGVENPPVLARVQELPLGDLTWENFERLCLRLVRLEADVEHCQLYASRRQDQGGIDLYARAALDEKYTVYQCKRVRGFGPAQMEEAVSTFLEGEDWPGKTKTFVLCTSESLVSTDRADKLEEQRAILNIRGISLVPWDKNELEVKLKDLPELVDDFFGRAWVEAFCGREQAEALGERLDAWKVAEFRSRVGNLYRQVFNTHDPGLPLAPPGGTGPSVLEDRYVVPDVLERRMVDAAVPGDTPRVRESSPSRTREELSSEEFVSVSPHRQDSPRRFSEHPVLKLDRRPVVDWLVEESRSVVLGGPGSGKSSLLRFIALDLLSESPRTSALARKWGGFLPVWVPFPLWTKLISDPATASSSFTQALHRWLESYDAADLWPVFELALRDERVLLLVDGLDEWADEGAAGIALDRLRVFVGQRDLPVVLASRPHGFARLGMRQAGWRTGEIGGLSREQQGQLTRIWFAHWVSALESGSAPDEEEIDRRADARAREFFAQLERAQDLRDLAGTPLLLCLLIYLGLHTTSLPQNRFDAYETFVRHLTSEHPRRRRRTASLTDELSPELSDDEVRDALAYLAYRLQEETGQGVVDQEQALRTVKEHLRDEDTGLGLELSEARRLGRDVVEVGEGAVGLLVERAPGEIGFFHRALQEYLAARHLSRLPLDEQADVVEQRCSDPQWREVILGTLHLTRRAEEADRLIGRVRGQALDEVEQLYARSLLVEIAFGDFGCTAALVRAIARDAFEQIEVGEWMPHRRDLLRHALEGMRSTRLREQVKAKLRSWFPAREQYRESLFAAIGTWPRTPEAVDTLLRGMHDEEPANQRAAGRALAAMVSGDGTVADRLVSLVRTAVEPGLRAAAIEALLQGWIDHPEIVSLLEDNRRSASPELRLVSILGRVKKGEHNDEDLEELLRLGSWNSDLGVWWRSTVGSALFEGWDSSERVKEACLSSLEHERQNRIGKECGAGRGQRNGENLEGDLALGLLLQAFSQDDDVATYCAEELELEEHPFLFLLGYLPFELLARNFRDNPVVVDALDEWMPKQRFSEPEVSLAAQVGRTSVAKAKLLASLADTGIPHWAAQGLLDGWGMEDEEVARILMAMAYGPASQASRIGFLLPRIIKDDVQCRDRLLELLKDSECDRPDFIMHGLEALDEEVLDPEIVDAVLDSDFLSKERERWGFGSDAVAGLISICPSDLRVRELALRELEDRAGNVAAVARSYGDDPEISGIVLSMACPLPVQLREMIAARLETGIGDEAFAMSVLKLYDHEVDPVVKTRASVSYHRRLKATGQDTTDAVARLSQSICSYGPDHEERRQAAFCGLVELDRLDVMLGAMETIGGERPCAITVVTGREPNVPLLRQILANWERIKGAFGEEFWTRLSKRSSGDLNSIWNQLLPLADEYPSARVEATEYLRSSTARSPGTNALRFLARAHPRNALLLEACLRCLWNGGSLAERWAAEDILVAAEVLGANFGGDNDVLQRITSHRKGEDLDEKEVLALCEGWPESDELEQIFARVRRENPPLTYGAYFQLVTRKGRSEAVASAVADVLSEFNSFLRWNASIVSRPVIRRLREDGDLEVMMFERLQDEPSPSEIATLPRLVGAARGLSPGLRAWCNEEANAQLGGRKPAAIGVDLLTGLRRPVVHCLLDALDRDLT